MTPNKVIVFGPTGNIGSITARTAQQNGAKVFLAMRDLQKTIPGLSPEKEQEGGFERVQADLEDPEAVRAAVTKTGAKHAFIYVVRTPDHMKSAITALKSAGIEFVVFLSSDGIRGDIRNVSPEDFISWHHAQVELNLEDILGVDGYVAVRPGYFATNTFRLAKEVGEGEVKLPYPDAKFDFITNGDIGTVCGILLARGLKTFDKTGRQNFIRLSGPELLSQRRAVEIIGKTIGKDIKVTSLDEHEGLEKFVKVDGLPEPVAKHLITLMKEKAEGSNDYGYHPPDLYNEAVRNTRKYAGREPTTFQEWAEENKTKFSA